MSKQKRNMTPLFWVDLTFKWYGDDMVFRVFIAAILFRINGKNGHLDENNYRHCYGIFFSKVAFWKLLDHSYVQSAFSTITRHTDNCILKDTLQFYILRTWINMRAKSFVKTSVNVTETKIDKVPGKISVAQKSKRALGRTLHQNRNVSLILCASFSLKLSF